MTDELEYKARLEQVLAYELDEGSHQNIDDGLCIMEAVAYVAGEPWSDSPICACPVISSFLRAWNDGLDTELRQDLKQYIPRLIGTRGSDALAERRSMMAADWLVRTHTPAWLRLAGLTTHADALSSLPEITSMAQAPSVKPAIEAARRDADAVRDTAWDPALAAARDAVRDTAWDAALAAALAAAWDAAWAAAWDAVRDTAWAAAWDAVRDTAWDAAWAAAWDAALAASWDAARDAAWDAAVKKKLQPTQNDLYQSAHALVARMLEAA